MRVDNKFARRKPVLKSNEPKKKYILAYEGFKTEPCYFNGIIDSRDDLEISSLIEIIPLLRDYNEKGNSHPKNIISELESFLKQSKENKLKVSSIIDIITNNFLEEKNSNNIRQEFEKSFIKDLNLEINDIISIDDSDKILDYIGDFLKKRKKRNCNNSISNIKQLLKDNNIEYEESYDDVCIIIDRDKQSFKDEQYDDVVKMCKKNKFKLYVTNPCFEFWLLMHFDEVLQMDREKIEQNKKINRNNVRYLENELKNIVPKYKKNDIQFYKFKGNIKKAIENEKYFEEDIDGLKQKIGSNIGKLISEMISIGKNF